MQKVVSVNISEKKGTIKEPVNSIVVNNTGIEGDAHSGNWNRQISLLGVESIEKFEKQTNRKIKYGEFAENITTRGITLFDMHPLDRLLVGDVELEITQIGKKCHGTSCQIFKTTGDCVMPKEGIFARVVRNGKIEKEMKLLYFPKIYKVCVITLSDRAWQGIYKDESGPLLEKRILDFFRTNKRSVNITKEIIPDEKEALLDKLNKYSDFDVIFTTGSTGIGSRDIAPDVIKSYIDKEIPGIMEIIRVKYGMEKPAALLSRSIAGTKNSSMIYSVPGSTKAVEEYSAEIFKTLLHSIHMIHSLDIH